MIDNGYKGPPGKKMWVPGGHKPFDYNKLTDLSGLANALRDIHTDIESALDAIEEADRKQDVMGHMRASMVLSGLEIKMTNFAADMRRQFLNRS